MAKPGTINKTKAVDVSIHDVMPESITAALPAKAISGITKNTVNKMPIVHFDFLIHFPFLNLVI